MKTAIVSIQSQSTETPVSKNPFQKFDVNEMHKFYGTKKQFLQCKDLGELLDVCVLYEERIEKHDGTYSQVYSPHYEDCGVLGNIERNYLYKANCTVEKTTFISTRMLVDKLDASLFYWRELNSELLRLLLSTESVKKEVVREWVRMVHYMAPAQSAMS